MGFNINAFIKPETKSEFSALLDEAMMLIKEVNEHLDKLEEDLNKDSKPKES